MRWVVIGSALLVWGCSKRSEENGRSMPCVPDSVLSVVGLAPARVEPVPVELIVPGEVVPVPSLSVEVRAGVAGRITAVYVQVGQQVARGAPLLRIRSPQLLEWEAQYRSVQAQLKAQQLKLQALERLKQDSLLSLTEWQSAQAELASLAAQVEQLSEQLQLFRRAGAGFLVLSPQAGTITHLTASVGATFEDEVEDFFAQQYVSARLAGVSLPEGAEAYVEPPYGATGEISRYVLLGNRPIRDLTALQNWVVERHLLQVPGVADVVTFGGEEKIYEVKVDLARLEAYNLTVLDVVEALSRSNINVAGDVIEQGDQAYVVRGVGLLESVEDIESVLITLKKSVPVYVKNVARVEISAKPRLGQCGLNKYEDVLQGIVLMRRSEDPSTVIPLLKEKIHELNTRILPPGVRIEPFLDRTELVQTTVRTVQQNLLEGALLLSLVVGLFLWEWRAVLIVVSVIPLAFLFALLMLRLQGLPANLISMGALDFGLLLEGSLVIVESVLVALAIGGGAPERAKRGLLRRVNPNGEKILTESDLPRRCVGSLAVS